jgi:UDP-2,4-diacetamido-2,4,6-trideoxy-beta-L-altropyranose hydrolase
MNIVFRTDASMQIGTGHVMRCLTLADALKAKGAICKFICRDHPGNLISRIRLHGFEVFVLSSVGEILVADVFTSANKSSYSAWLGVNWYTDAYQSKVGAGETAVDWVIIDHYALDARWEQALRPLCRKIMVIDDLADRLHDCDILLDQNLGRHEEDYQHLVPATCANLLGPEYSLLRPEFAALRNFSLLRRLNPQVNHMLITMGGVDQLNVTGQVLEALKDCELLAHVCITVVLGTHAPWLDQVRLIAKHMPQPTEVLVDVSNMAQLMVYSDFAIGAAGSTSWERCCLGLPSLICIQAANQQQISDALVLSGAAKTFDFSANRQGILEKIIDVVSNRCNLRKMSTSAEVLTDGNGVERVIAKMKAIANK